MLLYQTAIPANNLIEKGWDLRDAFQLLDFQTHVVGQLIHPIGVNTGFLQCVAELGVEHNAVVLGISQRIGVSYGCALGRGVLPNNVQR